MNNLAVSLLNRVSWIETLVLSLHGHPRSALGSSAPAKLSRGGREKKVTKKMKEARERGWVPESLHGK